MTNLHEFSKIHKYLMKIHVWFPLTIKKQNNLQRNSNNILKDNIE